jgi:hypothetical protein
LNFSADLFERGTIMVFVARFVGLLQRVADNPNQTLRELLAAPGLDTVAFANWVRERAAFDQRAAAVEAAAEAAMKAAAARAPAIESVDQPQLSEMEGRLATAWAELLGIEVSDVRASDNFLDLGGSSLLFMRAIAVMERELGMRIEPKQLLAQSLGELARIGTSSTQDVPAAGRPGPSTGKAASKPGGLVGKLFGSKRG